MIKYKLYNKRYNCRRLYALNIGDDVWELIEDKINKITITKKNGRRYFTRKKFYPLDAEEVDDNTKDMEECVGKGYIITKEVFGLN